MKQSYALGLDFGTTHSYLAYVARHGKDKVKLARCNPDPNSDYGNLPIDFCMPSVVYLKRSPHNSLADFEIEVGDPKTFLLNEFEPISRFKLDLAKSPDKLRTRREFRLDRSKDDYIEPVGIAGHLLWRMRQLALRGSDLAAGSIENITVTVPALSTVVHRKATQFAVRLAGFSGEIYTLEEPIAAYLYHHYRKNGSLFSDWKDRFALVFDFGGGTCDLSIIKFTGKSLPIVHARESLKIGGEDVDDLIVQYWLGSDFPDVGLNYEALLNLPTDLSRLRFLAKEAKENVSDSNHALYNQIIGSLISSGKSIGVRTLDSVKLSTLLRTKNVSKEFPDAQSVEGSVYSLIQQLIDKLVISSGIEKDDIEGLILAGGSSKLLGIQNILRSNFRNVMGGNYISDDVQISIAQGAAIHQLYRYSKDKKINKLVEPTLAQQIYLQHSYVSKTDQYQGNTILAEQNESLEIAHGMFNPLMIRRAEPEGKSHRIRLKELNRREPLLVADIPMSNRFERDLEVRFRITEYGVIIDFSCMARNSFWSVVPAIPRKGKFFQKDRIGDGETFLPLLEQFDLENDIRLRQMRDKYGIRLSE